ncbi:hybrid sensor histidine kinase/response regulator [Subsaximicrobium wynnwilliamsii]|nr:hybrid sensor histidine kinase/response regulator [Subsaximicrobium wynnwilliamsii]
MKLPLLIIYFIGLGLYAQDVPYNPQTSKGELYEYAQFADAGKVNLSISEVLSAPNIAYNNLESENHSVGFTGDNYWVRFSLENSDETQKTYYLETARPITDLATMFQISETGIIIGKSGDQIPFDERQVKHRSTIFKISIPAKTTTQIYLHLGSDGETINIPLNLYDEVSFWMVNYKQQLFLGLFYGLLLLAGTIYLFFFTSLREKTFLYYGLYVFSIGLMQAALDGFIHQYILSDGGFINSRAVMIAAILSNFFLLKYSEYFLKVDTSLPNFKKAYNTIYAVLAILFIMIFIGPKSLELVYPISNINGLLSLILILTTVFTMRYKRMAIDPYFSFGIFFLVIGLLGFVLNNLSLLPNNFFTLNSAKFGSAFEVIFLSLSMTNLIRNLRLEKEAIQDEALQKSEEISQLKSYFMSNISHELRTPINAIMGVAELELKDQNNSVENRKQYQVIKNASLSLLSNVNDILDFEKIEKNELVLELDEFNPSVMIHQISSNWKIEAEGKGLDYTFDMDHDIPTTVVGDAERFMQILNNVLGNAVKFTNDGHVTFKLKCTAQPKSVSRFSMQISDSGVGMDREQKKNVFDSFNQMRLNHKRQFGGIGLGLSIVRHLVGLFDGEIYLESETGKGTDVFIELPLKSLSKSETALNDIQKLTVKPQHILVVEDNKLNQMVMRKLLSGLPHISFAVVNNGQEAIDALQKEVYDLVLMDLQMPVMDGYEATEVIRSGKLGKAIGSIPIIAVTADAMQETRKKVLDTGMNDYMTKPVSKELLLQKIGKCQVNPILKIA